MRLWEVVSDGKTTSYPSYLPGSDVSPKTHRRVCPETGLPQPQQHSPSPIPGSPAASLMKAPSFLQQQQRGQREIAVPHSHTSQPGGQAEAAPSSTWLSASPAQCSHGWRLLQPSPSGLEEKISLPQSNPVHAKFPSAALQSPKIREEEGVEWAKSWKESPETGTGGLRVIRRLTLLAGDQWEPWQEHRGEPLPTSRRLLTPTLLPGWAAASPTMGQRGY